MNYNYDCDSLCKLFYRHQGSVAQLVEQKPLKLLVPGSSPGWPTIEKVHEHVQVHENCLQNHSKYFINHDFNLKYHKIMLDYQKLVVYQKAKFLYTKIITLLSNSKGIPFSLKDQISRSALSVMLNIAEGTGRFTNADKRHYFYQSRGSAFETLSDLEACFDLKQLSQEEIDFYQKEYEDVVNMQYGMIKKLS